MRDHLFASARSVSTPLCMKPRHWIATVLAIVLVALVIPPIYFWYRDGPRAQRTSDGLYGTYMRHGGESTVELSRVPPDKEPTTTELESASRLLDETVRDAKQFGDYRWATTAGGFTVSNAAILGRPHARYYHVWNPAHMMDGRSLDPSRPEALVYLNTDDRGQEMRLIGVMYTMPPGMHGPQPGGRLTRWHYHPAVEFCMDSLGIPRTRATRGTDGGCPPAMVNGPTPEMMHVWLVDNPYGAFAHQMALPGERAGHESGNVYAQFARRGWSFISQRLGVSQAAPDVQGEQHDDHTAHGG